MFIVLCLTLVDLIVLSVYTLLEGVVTQFSVGTASNKERPTAISGVSHAIGFYVNYITKNDYDLFRSKRSRLFT